MNKVKEIILSNQNKTLNEIMPLLKPFIDAAEDSESVYFHWAPERTEVCAYKDTDTALAIALHYKAKHDEDLANSLISEIMTKQDAFDVTEVLHDGELYYDFDADGTHCSLEQVIEHESWYESDWTLQYSDDDGFWDSVINRKMRLESDY